MRLREIALERRRLDGIDRQDREDQRVLAERVAVAAQHDPALAFDAAARFLAVARQRLEAAFERRQAARSGFCLAGPAARLCFSQLLLLRMRRSPVLWLHRAAAYQAQAGGGAHGID